MTASYRMHFAPISHLCERVGFCLPPCETVYKSSPVVFPVLHKASNDWASCDPLKSSQLNIPAIMSAIWEFELCVKQRNAITNRKSCHKLFWAWNKPALCLPSPSGRRRPPQKKKRSHGDEKQYGLQQLLDESVFWNHYKHFEFLTTVKAGNLSFNNFPSQCWLWRQRWRSAPC